VILKAQGGDDFNSTINARVHWLCEQNFNFADFEESFFEKNL